MTNFLVAGAFIVGMGAGVAFDTSVNLEPTNVASRDILDRQTPSSEVCMANGASAMVFDQRVFLSLNPFNIYVSQPEVKPGCVLRRSNWSILERNKLVNADQEADCKRNMNTFAFVGDLDKSPEVSCVYHSEEAENQYMKDPRRGWFPSPSTARFGLEGGGAIFSPHVGHFARSFLNLNAAPHAEHVSCSFLPMQCRRGGRQVLRRPLPC